MLLESLLDLMNSEYGFIGEIKYEPDGTMYLHNYSTTNIAWNDETRAFYDANVATGLKFYNLNTLFGRVMTTKEVVISNNPKEDPYAFGIPSKCVSLVLLNRVHPLSHSVFPFRGSPATEPLPGHTVFSSRMCGYCGYGRNS